MLNEVNAAQRFFKEKFGEGVMPPAGDYAVPTETSKGDAFMRVGITKEGKLHHFDLWWDEAMTISWYTHNKDGSEK